MDLMLDLGGVVLELHLSDLALAVIVMAELGAFLATMFIMTTAPGRDR